MANTAPLDQNSLAIDKPSSRLVTHKPSPWFNFLAIVVVISGIIYAGYHLADDLSVVQDTRAYPYILLGIALVIALGFEFVNGFHDTANAVATVIYTNSMSPNLAGRHQRRGLGPSDQDRPNLADFTVDRFQRGVFAADHTEGNDQNPGSLQGARGP